MKLFHKGSASMYVLQALVPYSRANMQLSFKPILFFRELDRRLSISEKTARSAMHRLKSKGLIDHVGGVPCLTDAGKRLLKLHKPKKLDGAELLIIFDIAESNRKKRDSLRTTLRSFKFRQIQRSVWATKYDCKEYISDEVERLGLTESVVMYEAREA